MSVMPDLWNHYAAAVFHSRLPFETVPTVRGRRYDGESKMRFLSLVMHGLNAISVFSDLVGVRLLASTVLLALACVAAMAGVLATRLAGGQGLALTDVMWVGSGTLLLLVLVGVCFSLVLTLMSQRTSLDFLPVRDFRFFIERVARFPPESKNG